MASQRIKKPQRPQGMRAFFYPTWMVFLLPLVWAIIITIYAILNPIQSDTLFLSLTPEVAEGKIPLEPKPDILVTKTIYYTARNIILNGLVLYILSCSAIYLWHGWKERK